MVRVLLLIFASITAMPGNARELRAADNQVADYPTVQALVYMGRLIEEKTGGRHRLLVFHSRQLGDEDDTIAQVRAGAVDLDRVNAVALSTLVPATSVLSLPFLFRSVDHLHAVLDGPIGEDILASFEPHGLIGLTFYDSGARSIYTRQAPIRSAADLKGLRIRVQPSSLMADMIKALGAVPVPLPYSQVETGLATGLIDGAENNWPSYVTTGHFRLAPYYSLTEHTMTPEVLVMSLAAWKSLSDEDKATVRAAARASNRFMREQWSVLEEHSRQRARAAGVTVVTPNDRGHLREATATIYAEAEKSPDLRRLIERIRQSN